MTPEEQLIQRYFDAFNRHDIEGVMACYHEEPVLVSPEGKRCVGHAEVRRSYEKNSLCLLTLIALCASARGTTATESQSLSSPGREPSVGK